MVITGAKFLPLGAPFDPTPTTLVPRKPVLTFGWMPFWPVKTLAGSAKAGAEAANPATRAAPAWSISRREDCSAMLMADERATRSVRSGRVAPGAKARAEPAQMVREAMALIILDILKSRKNRRF
jgi:hypothetical protein